MYSKCLYNMLTIINNDTWWWNLITKLTNSGNNSDLDDKKYYLKNYQRAHILRCYKYVHNNNACKAEVH